MSESGAAILFCIWLIVEVIDNVKGYKEDIKNQEFRKMMLSAIEKQKKEIEELKKENHILNLFVKDLSGEKGGE